MALSADGTKLYAVSKEQSTLYEVETARMVILRKLKLGDNLGSWDVVLIDNGRRAVVGNFNSKTLAFVDIASWTFTSVQIGGAPARMTVVQHASGDFIYVPLYDKGMTIVVRSNTLGSGVVIAQIITNSGGFDSAYDGQKIFVSHRDGREIDVIDVGTSTVTERWTTPREGIPYSIGVSQNGTVFSAYAERQDDKFHPDWADWPLLGMLKDSRNPAAPLRDFSICNSGPDGGEIVSDGTGGFFIACSGEGTTNWYRSDGSLKRSFAVGVNPFGLAFDQTRGILYVGVKGEGKVITVRTQ